jgi:PilZ domain
MTEWQHADHRGFGGRHDLLVKQALTRRAGIRRGDRPTKVLVSDADAAAEPFPGLVWNCSMGGLRLAVPSALEENTILSVRAADSDGGRPWIQVEVRWCCAREQYWELGCQFVRTPPYCELLLFG